MRQQGKRLLTVTGKEWRDRKGRKTQLLEKSGEIGREEKLSYWRRVERQVGKKNLVTGEEWRDRQGRKTQSFVAATISLLFIEIYKRGF